SHNGLGFSADRYPCLLRSSRQEMHFNGNRGGGGIDCQNAALESDRRTVLENSSS
ncbi:hypothetical protein TNIN_170161, partial [Trichonephila inaurata madagascariensis]